MLELRVKPVTLLKKAVGPIGIMAAKATLIYCPDGVSLQAVDKDVSVLAVLRLEASRVDYFRCDEEGYAGIDPKRLHLTLDSHVGEDWSVTIHGDDDDQNIGFVFQNDRDGLFGYNELRFLTEVPEMRTELDELLYEFKAVVGIPSSEFRRILMHLKFFGVYVNVYITDKLVKLSAVNEEIVLTKEKGECIIGGAGDEPIQFSFDLQQMASFLNASVLTSTVWILTPVISDYPSMINCPIGSLGNLMFYFS